MAQAGEDRGDELRAELLEQLGYLQAEMEAVRSLLRRVPREVLEGRPFEGERSVKEMYGLLAASDREAFLPALERIIAEDGPELDPLDEQALLERTDWNARETAELVEEVIAARADLVRFMEAMPAPLWERTARVAGEEVDVYGLAHAITQHDVEVLRAAGYRLHESRLTDRGEDLPK